MTSLHEVLQWGEMAKGLMGRVHLKCETPGSSVVNLSRAFCDPRPRSYQTMSAAQHLALINTIRIRARI